MVDTVRLNPFLYMAGDPRLIACCSVPAGSANLLHLLPLHATLMLTYVMGPVGKTQESYKWCCIRLVVVSSSLHLALKGKMLDPTCLAINSDHDHLSTWH